MEREDIFEKIEEEEKKQQQICSKLALSGTVKNLTFFVIFYSFGKQLHKEKYAKAIYRSFEWTNLELIFFCYTVGQCCKLYPRLCHNIFFLNEGIPEICDWIKSVFFLCSVDKLNSPNKLLVIIQTFIIVYIIIIC